MAARVSAQINFDVPPEFAASLSFLLPWAVPVQVLMFICFGLYRGIWRLASLSDLKRILLAIGTSTLAVVVMLLMLQYAAGPHMPRSVVVIDPILLLFMGGSRFVYRSWKEHKLYGPSQLRGKPVLILAPGLPLSR